MGKALAFSVAATLFATGTAASAADYSYSGSLAGPNAVQLFNFTVTSPSSVTLRTYSYAGGINAAGQTITSGGFDPILALFDGSGELVGENDDGGLNVPADATTGSRYDTFLQALLQPGTYTVSVAAYSNFAIGPNLSNGFENDGTFDGRANRWAFDILNVNSAIQVGAVPEPGTWALMLVGFGAIGASLRRRRRATAVPALA
ncbi:hypothetical protein GGQ97_000723 [Sphingomonas kaistensis]|uniref:Ice-binding protein C-terminal domain-containing protein n=1 Tax=Sphingomonas kaistensis TaxID=298708 RepID=A0A7X5Y6R5_9SPHN|nr:DVUA0089 family protein [Sphingomonas kaistensis]NJC04930.1 hypothetical protein [Sphingomonas kaistensis]